jgi:replicative DNA helicase
LINNSGIIQVQNKPMATPRITYKSIESTINGISNNASNRSLRVPPNNLEAERAVLGSLMIRSEAFSDVLELVGEESFYSEKHKMIFKTMYELFNASSPIDLVAVKNLLEEKQILEQVGGASYLAELVHVVPSAANLEHYAEIVQKKSYMRNLISASEHICQLGYDEVGHLDQVLDQAEKKIFEITNKTGSAKFRDVKDILKSVWEQIDKIHNSDGTEARGVMTGFAELDAKTSGFQKSDLIIIAARPSVGKTSLALDFARNAAVRYNVPVGIFSLEMSAAQLINRMLSAESMVDSWKMRTGKLSRDEDFAQIGEAMSRLSKAPIYIEDTPGNNIIKMRSVARRLKSEKGLGLIIVDYLQLMVPTQSAKSDNVVQQVTEISRSLKNLARELEVPVIALSQLSRAVEQRGGKPRLSDLRDSGSIEQDADLVMFIHREDKYKDDPMAPNTTEIMIEKHRNGPTGSIQLYFNNKITSFQNMEKKDFGDFADHMAQ